MLNKSFISYFDFSEKVVLVTASSHGIGACIAKRFAELGANIAIHYRHNHRGAEATANQIVNLGQQVCVVKGDLSISKDVTEVFQQIRTSFGKLDLLINNAGAYPNTPLLDISENEWDEVLDSNLKSAFLCTQAAGKMMKNNVDGGVIVNISSIEGLFPGSQHTHYSTSKSALIMLTKSAALELAPYNIRVNAISPGLIHREGINEAWPEGVEKWNSKAPLYRLGTPLDIANSCIFLCSEAASWITGTNLPVDGGILSTPAF
jgi:NAD(P)-dependent dehydrogenase (short-subunit alcohol dehydrogenase family)